MPSNRGRRADRSGVDRYLGMVEAAGSIPARSIVFKKIIPDTRLYIVWYKAYDRIHHAHPRPDPSRRPGFFNPLF